MSAQDETLQHARMQDDSFQAVEAEPFQPPERRRPAADSRARRAISRQTIPGNAGVRMMLDVVTVVEQQQVVHRSVVARGAAGMLVMAVERAEGEAAEIPGQVGSQEERRRSAGDRRPEQQHERRLQDDLS